jgi:hypothetical protein
MIAIAFLGPTNSLEQVIMGDLHRHPESPIQDVETWSQFEMVVSKWTKRFKEKGVTVLARYDRFQTPQPIIPYVESLILEEAWKEGISSPRSVCQGAELMIFTDDLSALLSGVFLT